MSAAPAPELKRLAFVPSYASAGVDYVAKSKTFAAAKGIYSHTKESSILKPGVETIESYIKTYGAPLLCKAKEHAPAYLAVVDAKVDGTIMYAHDAYASGRTAVAGSKPVQAVVALKASVQASHPDNLELFKKARDEYFQLIETSIESLKAKGTAYSSELTASTLAAIADARAKAPVEAKAVFHKAVAAWEQVASQPTVAATLDKVLPKITLAKEKALSLLGQVQSSQVYKSYAEPTISKVYSSSYVQGTISYLKPMLAPMLSLPQVKAQ